MASAAQWERRIIGVRTREAMAARKAAGVRLGRPRLVPDEVCRQIQDLRDAGHTWQQVSDVLNDQQVPTGQGRGPWYPATARTALLAYDRDLPSGPGESVTLRPLGSS